ncbi:MAG: ATP-dependent dethiobiotin synthetase BioD, partial [Marinobacter sp.]|uniref:ATP-dependent dethiobiotin synthetase BioD n=1 Tax=Marinobacter sp. TaxID=50741 RepID=UPI00299D40EA
RTLTAQRLVGFCRGLQMHPAELFLVEGAGGWRVPLNDSETYSRFAMELALPVILVVPLKLGCINHALLTAEAIRSDGLTLAGWVANRPEQSIMEAEADTLSYLQRHLPAPCLGVLPWQSAPDPLALAALLDVSPLIEN